MDVTVMIFSKLAFADRIRVEKCGLSEEKKEDSRSQREPIMPMDYDLLIIGGRAAGKEAALLAARAGLKTLLVEKESWAAPLITEVTI